jgi:PrcB C-terminal
MRVLLFIAISLLLSCKSTEAPTQLEANPVAVIFSELNSGTNGGFQEKTYQVITDQNTFNEVWSKAFANLSNQQRPAKIDFENKMIVLVASGMQTSGGHKIKVKSVEEIKSAIVLNIENSKPGESCNTTSIITFPYQIIELKKSKKEVTFNVTDKIYECEK